MKAGVSLLENSTIADKLESSLLTVEGLNDFVGNSVSPGLCFLLVVGFSVKVLLNDLVTKFIEFVFDV